MIFQLDQVQLIYISRFKAIEEGSKKALDKFIAYLGTLGLRDEKL